MKRWRVEQRSPAGKWTVAQVHASPDSALPRTPQDAVLNWRQYNQEMLKYHETRVEEYRELVHARVHGMPKKKEKR